MTRRVKLNNVDVFERYKLTLTHRDLGTAEPNIYTVEVPGRDSKIDITAFYGALTYRNRIIVVELERFYDENTSEEMRRWIDTFNGTWTNFIFSDDPDHYWRGRLYVTECDNDTVVDKVKLTLDAFPFKFKVSDNSEVR